MSQVKFNINMDEDVKKQFDAFCNGVGMNADVAVNLFARAVIREKRIPFEIAVEAPNAETAEAIEEVRRMKEDPSLGKSYTDVDQMMKELLA